MGGSVRLDELVDGVASTSSSTASTSSSSPSSDSVVDEQHAGSEQSDVLLFASLLSSVYQHSRHYLLLRRHHLQLRQQKHESVTSLASPSSSSSSQAGTAVDSSSSSSSSSSTTTARRIMSHPSSSSSDGGSSQVPWFLPQFTVFALALALAGRNWWWLVAGFYFLYRIAQTDYGRRCRSTFSRDLKGLFLLISVKREISRRLAQNRPIHEIFLEKVNAHPSKEAIVDVETERSLTYAQLNALANRYAHYFQTSTGLKSGDVVSLFVENCADYFAIWLGLSKIGVVSAFINTNLKLEPLGHSIKVAQSKCIITCDALTGVLRAAQDANLVQKDAAVYVIDDGKNTGSYRPIRADVDKSDVSEPGADRAPDFQSVLCYIYTSGTTGNPKPAVIKHFRYYWMAMGSGRAFGVIPSDRVYITMPLYHSAAGALGIGQIIAAGTTAIIRKKFSASNFWRDCVKHEATASQYIGEICRYLLAQPESAEEKQHQVRVMWGNGLRAAIWPDFVKRFGIKRVGELYGSTEGNSNLVNLDNHVGSCGFMPIYPYITALYPVRLVKIDEETGEIIRGRDGLCVPCRPGDTGEMVGMIKRRDLLLRFEGYVSEGDTKKKILRDCFTRGDEVFLSGDVLHWDEYGYLYFRDRQGDTFRWKGENVSTTEVESILQPVKSVIDATVYGVEIPGMEGRAGMAGIQLDDGVDQEAFLREIADKLAANLAGYAIPMFVRLCGEVEKTGTFKLKKNDLQKASWKRATCSTDPLFYWEAATKSYRPLTDKMEADIVSGAYKKF